MNRVMHHREIEKAASIAAPIGHARRRKIEPSRYLPLEGVPSGIDVRGPEDRAVALGSKICGTREDHYSALVAEIAAESLVDTRCMEQRIHIKVASPWA